MIPNIPIKILVRRSIMRSFHLYWIMQTPPPQAPLREWATSAVPTDKPKVGIHPGRRSKIGAAVYGITGPLPGPVLSGIPVLLPLSENNGSRLNGNATTEGLFLGVGRAFRC
jgi:hypothetical protein